MSGTTCQEPVLPRLDPRKPLVLDTHELERRPGTMRTITRRVPAPPDLGTEVVGVPAGADLKLELRLESVLDGILVSGTARAIAVGECARCLERVEQPICADLQELFGYPEHADPDDEGASVVAGELIDLEPTVRDALVLALPLAPVCRPDCPGLCPECGAVLADEHVHQHEQIDPRWAALQTHPAASQQPAPTDDDVDSDRNRAIAAGTG